MKKFKLLLLDANVVIILFKLGIWENAIELCDIHLSRTIAEVEAHFYLDDAGERQDFDVMAYARAGKISVFDIAPSELDTFRAQFDPVYFEKLDPGETESLAYLLKQGDDCRICSADKIVYRILGNIRRGNAGVSLEEVLHQTGLGRKLDWQFSKAFREQATQQGFNEGMRGQGLKR